MSAWFDRRIAVTNATYAAAMAVTIGLLGSHNGSKEEMLGMCALVFAVANLGLVVGYGAQKKAWKAFLPEQALLLVFIGWVIMQAAFLALGATAAGADPSSALVFAGLAIQFPVVAILVNMVVAYVAPRLLARKQ